MDRFLPSDERIKECICPLKNLLPKLDQIDFVSYDRIDKQAGSYEAGIIAQNVIQVFPNMVSLKSGYLPNVQQKIDHTLMADDIVFIRMTNTLPLKENDIVLCLITAENGTQHYPAEILHATDVSIEVKKWINYSPNDEVFLHGIMVDDYHNIDITQIGVLGAACAKELYQVVKCQAETITTLNETCVALQAANAATSSQLALLNGTCATLQAANAATSSQLALLQKQIDDITARLS